MEATEKFDCWAIVEVMGHNKYAGHVTEQAIGGTSFVRVDVPALAERQTKPYGWTMPAQPAFTKLLGGSSIFAITPCTEEVARRAAEQFGSAPVTAVDLSPASTGRGLPSPVAKAEQPSAADEESADYDQDDY